MYFHAEKEYCNLQFQYCTGKYQVPWRLCALKVQFIVQEIAKHVHKLQHIINSKTLLEFGKVRMICNETFLKI